MHNLKGILKNGFSPRYCLEYTLDSTDRIAASKRQPPCYSIPMVCFCDLPLSLIRKHLDEYGGFGIGLRKSWGVKHGVEPVFYTHSKGQTRRPMLRLTTRAANDSKSSCPPTIRFAKRNQNTSDMRLPHKPGVYLMKDRFGTVIYVGKARDLRKRVSTYFHPSRRMGWDLKFNALVEAIHDLDTYTVRTEPEALLLEGKLIKEYQPRYNISFRDDKRFLLIKVNLNDPIPRFVLTRLRQDDGARYFGPFVHSSSARHTLTLARRKFNLRGCRPFTPGAEDYKHCLYGHLKYCTAPCIGNVALEDYRRQVVAACEFLDGQTGEMERELEEQMKKAAAAEDFEKAAQFRDALDDLRRTTQKTKKFPRMPYTLPIASTRSATWPNWRRCSICPASAGAHRGLRHFQHQRHFRRRVDGQFSRRQAGSLQLPALPHENRDRPG
jgi:hypothetical protein